jgi:hypothetical protein
MIFVERISECGWLRSIRLQGDRGGGTGSHVMIDREKVLAVLNRRFPSAASQDVAAAANAIVSLDSELEPIGKEAIVEFACVAGRIRYELDDVQRGRIAVLLRTED